MTNPRLGAVRRLARPDPPSNIIDNIQYSSYSDALECHDLEHVRNSLANIQPVKLPRDMFTSRKNRQSPILISISTSDQTSSNRSMWFAIWEYIYLDNERSMKHHISTVVRASFFHLRRLKSIRRILGADLASGLVSAFVTTRSLQLHSGSTPSVINRSTATCPECGYHTHHWHRNTRTRHSRAT